MFDIAFWEQVAGTVWIIQSDENRRWFDKQSDLDAGSAIFSPEGGKIGCDAILRSIWNVQEHYPDWLWIHVYGAVLTQELASELRDEGNAMEMEKGFALVSA